jgi:S-disulfanyl-L-cysteine oxidoreductase SoxD
MEASTTRLLLLRFFLPVVILGGVHVASAQSPTYGLGKTPTAEEISARDISVSPDGKGLPPGSGTAKEGAQIFAQKCAACHGATGSGGPAPNLIKEKGAPTPGMPCLVPCITEDNVMSLHSPYATTMWDFINRAMPYLQERTLKPNEVYSLVAFLLYKNGVIHEEDVMDAKSLPLVKMPNREGYVVPEWKHGMPMPISTKPKP